MNRITTLALRTWVGAQVAASSAADEAKSRAARASHNPEQPYRRAQIASGAVAGWMAATTATALAAGRADDAQGSIVDLIKNVGNFLVLIIAAASVVLFCWSAFLFVTSAGNQQAIDRAKTTAKNVVIGLALACSIALIQRLIVQVLDGATGNGGGDSETRDAVSGGGGGLGGSRSR